MTAYMQYQPPSKYTYNNFNQCRTILERNRASLVSAERTSAFEEDTNLFMRQVAHESKIIFIYTCKLSI